MMDSTALEQATLKCLSDLEVRYKSAKINSVTPISGGYSRLTYKYEIAHAKGKQDLILQYLPKGATGLVRVDRKIENDLLSFLSSQNKINAPTLLVSDVAEKYFDSAAYIFEAETGRPFIETCREADVSGHGQLNMMVAKAGAAVHQQDISTLPKSMMKPASWTEYIDAKIDFFRQTEAQSATSRPFLRFMAQWLDDNRPPEAPLSLVHGDFQTSNMLERGPDDTVLVDWELAHIGDPREDLGWFTMVCGAIPPNILESDVDSFYKTYRNASGLGKDIINPATSAFFLIISSIPTHMGMMKSSDALAESPEQAQSVLAAYYTNITTYQHINWMNAVKLVESFK